MQMRPENFVERLEELGAEWGESEQGPIVEAFGDGDKEYWAVRSESAGLVDRSERETLVLTGEDAVPWLQGLVTSDLLDLQEPGSGLWTCATNVNGRMVGDMRVMHVPEMLLVDLEPGVLEGGLLDHLKQQIILEDVELDDRTETTGRIGVFGRRAADVLGRAGQWETAPSEIAEFDGTWGVVGGDDVIIQSRRWTGGPGFDLYFERGRSRAVWEGVMEAGGDEIRPVGARAMETLRIEAGVPRFGVETHEKIIPLEANLGELISFEKGCYVGQEIIARLDTRGTPAKRLRTLIFEGGAAPHEGAELEADGRDAGEVVSAAWSPLLEAPIALAYVKRNVNDPGTQVDVEGRVARVELTGYPLAERADQTEGAA